MMPGKEIQFTRWLFRWYLLVLLLVPFPLGSNRPIFWGVMTAAAALLVLIWAMGLLAGLTNWHNSAVPTAIPASPVIPPRP